MTSFHAQNEIFSICGFSRAMFASGKTVLILENGIVKHINLSLENPRMLSLNVSGCVAALSVANDFSIFALAVEEDNASRIVVYSLEFSIDKEKAVYGTQYLPTEISISQAAEVNQKLKNLNNFHLDNCLSLSFRRTCFSSNIRREGWNQ